MCPHDGTCRQLLQCGWQGIGWALARFDDELPSRQLARLDGCRRAPIPEGELLGPFDGTPPAGQASMHLGKLLLPCE